MCGTQSRSYVTIAASLSTDGSGDTTLIAAATTVSVFFVLALALLLKRRLNKPGRGDDMTSVAVAADGKLIAP